MIKLNCENCARCCYSKKPGTENLILHKPEEHRENLVILTHDEVKNFWHEGFGSLLFVSRLYREKDKTVIKIGIANFLKMIDGEWWAVCPFLDPSTKKCRIYKTELSPLYCKSYPYINLLYNRPTNCGERVSGEMDKAENDKAKKYFEMIKFHDAFGMDENFDKLKEIITRRGPFLVCQKLVYNSFGEPRAELKTKYKEIFEIIQKEHQFSLDAKQQAA